MTFGVFFYIDEIINLTFFLHFLFGFLQTAIVPLLINDVVALDFLALLEEAGDGKDQKSIDTFFWTLLVDFSHFSE